jgi:DHA2 family multidrug resistance protein-like MFS transporter
VTAARRWLGLAVLGLPTVVLAVDLSVVYLALPQFSEALHASGAQQLWITDIYGFVTAGFVITMGTLADHFGRRRLLLVGGAAFGVASLVAAYSVSAPMLIAARAAMGLAGATLMPSTLALITTMFTDREERALAIAVWTSCFLVGAAIGPLVGGVLLERYWWGSVFLIALPVMALLLVAGPALLPEYRDPSAAGLDAASVLLLLLAILPVVYAIKEFATDGFEATSLAAGLVGLTAGRMFLERQRRLPKPLLDLTLFADRAFSASLVILLAALAVQSGIVLLLSEHLQIVERMSPLRAAWLLMPATIAMAISCASAPLVARFMEVSRVVAGGLIVTAIGFIVLAFLSSGGNAADAWLVIAGSSLIFAGLGPTAVFSQALIVGSAPPAKAGMASALSEASGDFGMALGVALFGALGAAVYARVIAVDRLGLSAEASDRARESVAGALAVARGMSRPMAHELMAGAHHAFTLAVRVAAMAGAMVTAALAVLALRMLKTTTETERA